MTEADTSADAVERLAASLTQSFPDADHGGVDQAVGMGEHGVDALVLLDADATLRALVRERDEARAAIEQMRAPYEIIVRREWQAGAEAMREAALGACRAVSQEVGDPAAYRGKEVPPSWREAWDHAAGGASDCVDAIHALPIPERPA